MSRASASQTFCLLLDPKVETDRPTQAAPQELRYLELSSCERFANRGGTLSRPHPGVPSIRLQSVRHKSQNSLLMSVDPGVQVTVNGLRAACFRVLIPGDVIAIGELVLHLSLFNRPYTGPPDENHLAAKCGYCRVPIQDEADMRVYVCPNCQSPTHCQGEEVSIENRLECAKLSSHCGHCQAEIVESEGWTHVPPL